MFSPLTIITSTSKYLENKLQDLGLVDRKIVKTSLSLFQQITQTNENDVYPQDVGNLREESIFLQNPEKFAEIQMPNDGSCLFHSIQYWLNQYKAYLVANKLLNNCCNDIPNPYELRMEVYDYIKKNHISDWKLQKILNFCLEDYNDYLFKDFVDNLRNFDFLLNEVSENFQNETFLSIGSQVSHILKTKSVKFISELEENLKIYIESLKTKKNSEDLHSLCSTLIHTLIAAQPIKLEDYIELYKNPQFFGNRDAIYALSKIYHINIYIYQKAKEDKMSLLKSGDPRVCTYSSSFDIPALLNQLAPLCYIVYRGNNHYNVLDN